MKIDLHSHTSASDGLRAPENLVDYAAEKGLSALAITDHDTVDGIDAALRRGQDHDIEVIPGIEFSVDYDEGTFHLVGLYIDWKNKELVHEVMRLAKLRESRAERIVEDLNAKGFPINFDEVREEASGGAIGKPHVARVLVRRGHAADPHEVYTKFLEEGLPGHVKKEKISRQRSLELIRNAGGVSILAHPASLDLATMKDFEFFLRELIDLGLEGVEAYSDMHSPEVAAEYREIAERHGLLVSGGSDYHGDKGEIIGYYKPDHPIPAECYTALREYMSRRRGNVSG